MAVVLTGYFAACEHRRSNQNRWTDSSGYEVCLASLWSARI